MFSRLLDSLRSRKTKPSPVDYGLTQWLSPEWARILGIPLTSGQPSAISEQEALTIPAFFAGLKSISEDMARHSYYVAQQTGHDQYLPKWEHPLNRVLNWRANPEMSSYSFIQCMVFNAAFRRGAYAEIVGTERRKVAEMWPLKTCDVEVKRNESTLKLEYVHRSINGQVTLPRDRVLHLHGFSEDGIIGIDWVQLHASTTLAFPTLMQKMLNAFMRNDGRPSGVMLPPDNFVADQQKLLELENSWNKRYSGDKKGRVAFAAPGFKYQQLGMDFDSAQIEALVKLSPYQVCSLIRLPPSIIGLGEPDAQDVTKYNVNCLGPWRAVLEGEFTRLVDDENLVVIADEWELTRGDYATRSKAHTDYIRAGVITRNEVRDKEGLPRIEEEAMDQPSIEWNSIPANKVAEVMDARIAKDKGAGGPLDIANSPRDSANVRKIAHAFTSVATAAQRGLLRRERDRLNKHRGGDYAKHAADVMDKQLDEARQSLAPIVESLVGVTSSLGINANADELLTLAAEFHAHESRSKVIEQHAAPWTDEQVDAEAKRRATQLVDELSVALSKESE